MDDGQYEALEKRPRRRRRRRRRPRGLLLLPHLITTANLAFGFFAIVQSFAGRHDLAALGIVLAALADAIDGRVARLAGASSRFGLEYDSIADTVSFGVAPAMLAFAAGNLQVLGKPGWVMAFMFTVCAALRLARFNVSPGRYKGRFEGMVAVSPGGLGTVVMSRTVRSCRRRCLERTVRDTRSRADQAANSHLTRRCGP